MEHYAGLNKSDIHKLWEDKDVEGLLQVLKHNSDKHVLKVAILALGELKDQRAIKPIIEWAFKHHGGTVKSAAITALGNIGGDEAVESHVFVMLKDEPSRAEAVESLGKIGDTKAVKPLVLLLEDEKQNQYIREKVIEALGKIGAEEAISSIIVAFDSCLGEKASEVLKEVGKSAVMPLITALNSDSQIVREKVITILGEIGDNEATEPLITILDDTKQGSEFGAKVVQALGNIKDDRAVEPLIAKLEDTRDDIAPTDDDYPIKCHAMIALGDIGDNRATKPLMNLLLNNTNPGRIRGLAAWALGKIGNNKAVEQLTGILENHREDEFVKYNTAWALLQLDENRTSLQLLRYIKENPGCVATIFEPLDYHAQEP